ncbi:poly(A) RNA polymerase gld-2-like [Oppia nitens]|uniref:poly(A) RNA polymerase gld-2-like n=1 Tax=Oppia nitens TaxID=1686743 RepID=UPI0023DB61FD|nr:poly(A) RNA polymerase gld-2-like [Oppia nitens]
MASRNMPNKRDRLSREVWKFFEDNCQTTDLLTRKNRLRDALQKILTQNFANYDVQLFIVGSTNNGLASNKSDVDICLVMNEANPAATASGSAATTDDDHKPTTDSLDTTAKTVETPKSPEKSGHEEEEANPKVVVDEETKETDGEVKKEPKIKDVDVVVEEEEEDVVKEVTELNTSIKEEKIKEISNEEKEDKEDESSKLNQTIDSIEDTNSVNGSSNDPSLPVLEKVREVLKGYNFVLNMQIIMAKVPILKFVDRISGIEVTLNVNKLVSIRNTQLIHDYTKLDWRVQPLAMVVKAWARDNGINDAYNKSISSYSLVLMVIHYLQYACSPPVLPCLQQLDAGRYRTDSTIQSLRQTANRRPKQWKSDNTSSLKHLLLGFLEYYSYNFCYTKDAISVRLAHVLPKHIVQRYKSDENAYGHWKLLSIEEPFNRTNTARSVYDDVIFERITSVFRVSHYTLRRIQKLSSIMTSAGKGNDYDNDINQYVMSKNDQKSSANVHNSGGRDAIGGGGSSGYDRHRSDSQRSYQQQRYDRSDSQQSYQRYGRSDSQRSYQQQRRDRSDSQRSIGSRGRRGSIRHDSTSDKNNKSAAAAGSSRTPQKKPDAGQHYLSTTA